MTKYNYCVLSTTASEKYNGAPVLNDKGQIVGIYNSNGTLQSATDAKYGQRLCANWSFSKRSYRSYSLELE